MTKLELMETIKSLRQEIEKKSNTCDGTVELLEEYLSVLLEELEKFN